MAQGQLVITSQCLICVNLLYNLHVQCSYPVFVTLAQLQGFYSLFGLTTTSSPRHPHSACKLLCTQIKLITLIVNSSRLVRRLNLDTTLLVIQEGYFNLGFRISCFKRKVLKQKLTTRALHIGLASTH